MPDSAMLERRLHWKSDADFFCDVCAASKCVHTAANRTPVEHFADCGALVCGDIIRPFTPTKPSGYRYAAVFVSAYGKVVDTYPMKRKNEFFCSCSTFILGVP